MDLSQHSYQLGDTIAAIATPPGEGGVAVIRISGERAISIANKVFSGDVPSFASHTAHFGRVLDSQGGVLDHALLIVFREGRSYTGETTVELQGHGGALISRRVLERVLEAGARPASPGEFTYRAFVNGKLDLVQAEAVQELIHAKNELAVTSASGRLEGQLSKRVADFQERLTALAAILEAWVDFPEEGLEFTSEDQMVEDLIALQAEIQRLADTYHDGRLIHEGLALALIGCPNVGKSSLMNALLERERAIVTHVAGTTRDVVEDEWRFNGLHVRLIDTAGIREVDEIVEQEGIRRSRQAMTRADRVLFVLDASRGLGPEDEQLMAELPRDKTIVVWNKVDLPAASLPDLSFPHVVRLSAKTREGVEALKICLDKALWTQGPPSKEEVVLTSVRHRRALVASVESMERVIQGLNEGVSPEFLTMDIREALKALSGIMGRDVTEDILSSIFATFCVGK